MDATALKRPEADLDALFSRWHDHQDRRAQEELVERFLPLARGLARRYRRSSEPFEDLCQVASLGLVKALERFDPSRGYPFRAFAVPTILGELKRYFRDSGWAVHVSRGVQERALAVEEASAKLSARFGRAPTIPELAERLECSSEDVLEALQAARAYDSLSLDAPRIGADGEMDTYGSALGSEDERYELIDADASIAAAIRHLPERERMVLHLRFVDDLTQTQIAERIGVSQMQVSRLLRRALDRLRTLARADEDVDAG